MVEAVEVTIGFTEAQSFRVRKLARALIYLVEVDARMKFHTEKAEKHVLKLAKVAVRKKIKDLESHNLTMKDVDGLLRMFCRAEANQRINILLCVACCSCAARDSCLKKNPDGNTDFKKMVFYCPDFLAEHQPDQYDDFGCDKKNIVVAEGLRNKF